MPATYLLDTNIISAAMRDELDLDTWLTTLPDAATALALDATLVTRDSDFARIEGLTVVSARK